MRDADELFFVTEGDDAMPVLKSDRARGLEARRGDAHEFIEEDAAIRVASALWHKLKAAPGPPAVWYHDTTHECQSIEAPQGWRIAHVRRERLKVANRRILLKNSEIEGWRKSRIRAQAVVYASRCHSKACERVARSKAGRSAEPLSKFPLRLPAVF